MAIPTWTAEAEKKLGELAAEGLSAAVIADRLGVSRNAVIGKAHRANVALLYHAPPGEPKLPREPRPPRGPRSPRASRSSPEAQTRRAERSLQHQIVREMYLAGDTYTSISNETGYTPGAIVTITRGLPRRRNDDVRKRYTQAQKVEAVVALLTGERLCRVSDRLGYPRRALDLWRAASAVRSIAQPIADAINAEREAAARTEAALKAQADARERMWVEANNAEVYPRMPLRHADMMRRRAAGETLDAVGKAFGVTRERIRQIEARWRLEGLIVPGTKPLSDAAKRAVYVPTGAPRGRKPNPNKPPKPKLSFWEAVAAAREDDALRACGKRRPYNISPEGRQARAARMSAYWAAKRAEAAA